MKPEELERKMRKGNLLLHLTRKCPYRCKHCYINAGECMLNELSKSEIFRILNDLSSLVSSARVVLSGGEPTERSDLVQIISYCKKMGFTVQVNTNGFYIDEKLARGLAKADFVDLTIYGDKETHDEFVGRKGAFERAIKAAENLEKFEVNFALSYLLHKKDLDVFPSVLKLIEKRLEIENKLRVCFFTFCHFGRGRNIKPPSVEEIKRFTKKAGEMQTEVKLVNCAKILTVKELLETKVPICEFYEIEPEDILDAWNHSPKRTEEIISGFEPMLKIPRKMTLERIKNLKVEVNWCSDLRKVNKGINYLSIYPNGEAYICPMGGSSKISDFLRVGNVREGLKTIVENSKNSNICSMEKKGMFSLLAEKQGIMEETLTQNTQCAVCIRLLEDSILH